MIGVGKERAYGTRTPDLNSRDCMGGGRESLSRPNVGRGDRPKPDQVFSGASAFRMPD